MSFFVPSVYQQVASSRLSRAGGAPLIFLLRKKNLAQLRLSFFIRRKALLIGSRVANFVLMLDAGIKQLIVMMGFFIGASFDILAANR